MHGIYYHIVNKIKNNVEQNINHDKIANMVPALAAVAVFGHMGSMFDTHSLCN